MAVAYDSYAISHGNGSFSTNQASFSWTHNPTGTPRGILVFTFSNTTNDNATSVTYDGISMTAVSGGRAVFSGTYGGEVKAWFLGSGIPTLSRNVVVNRTNNADEMWGVSFSVTAAADTSVHTAGIVLIQNSSSALEQSVTDGQSSGTNNSVRFAAINANAASVFSTPTSIGNSGDIYPGVNSTMVIFNDTTNYALACVRETTSGIGARNTGFTYTPNLIKGITNHTCAVHLAVKEGSGGGGGSTTSPAMLLAMMIAQEARNERITYGGLTGNYGI